MLSFLSFTMNEDDTQLTDEGEHIRKRLSYTFFKLFRPERHKQKL